MDGHSFPLVPRMGSEEGRQRPSNSTFQHPLCAAESYPAVV